MELDARLENVGDGGAGAKDLVPRHDHESEVGDHVDPEPLAPGAERPLLRDGHNEPDGIGQLTPDSEGPFGAFESDGEEEGVVRVHVRAEEAELWTDVPRRDGVHRGRSWNVR